jgi:hypothetical protein
LRPEAALKLNVTLLEQEEAVSLPAAVAGILPGVYLDPTVDPLKLSSFLAEAAPEKSRTGIVVETMVEDFMVDVWLTNR